MIQGASHPPIPRYHSNDTNIFHIPYTGHGKAPLRYEDNASSGNDSNRAYKTSNGSTKPLHYFKTLPKWPVNNALAWKEKRKREHHRFSLNFRHKEKDRFVDVKGSDCLRELDERDHVSDLINISLKLMRFG
jgi:hypothetical protein